MQTRWHNVHVLQHSRFKTASPQEKGQVVPWFIEFKSALHDSGNGAQPYWTVEKVGRMMDGKRKSNSVTS
ncbi:hypothetical protein TNCV_3987791 [Trichonephila clavipes]|nr:hypothetical protein TNCV_3987791 [Trichonephila clavipes]